MYASKIVVYLYIYTHRYFTVYKTTDFSSTAPPPFDPRPTFRYLFISFGYMFTPVLFHCYTPTCARLFDKKPCHRPFPFYTVRRPSRKGKLSFRIYIYIICIHYIYIHICTNVYIDMAICMEK